MHFSFFDVRRSSFPDSFYVLALCSNTWTEEPWKQSFKAALLRNLAPPGYVLPHNFQLKQRLIGIGWNWKAFAGRLQSDAANGYINDALDAFQHSATANYGEAGAHRLTNGLKGAMASGVGKGGTHGTSECFGYGRTSGPTEATKKLLREVCVPGGES